MANITVRRNGEIKRTVMQILTEHPEGMAAKDVLAECARRLPLTDFEKADYPNRPGTRRFEKIARFSTITLVKAGWLTKVKGVWAITADGKSALSKYKEPEDLQRAGRLKYRQWKAVQEPDTEEGDAAEVGETIAAATLEEAEENAWTEINQHLAAMPPYDFQELVGGLLRGMGYYVSYISPPGPDRGIDIVAHRDPLGIEIPRIKVQVKRRSDKINVDGVRSFLALLSEGDAGIFVSTGGFTLDAEREARAQERRKLMLVDAERLFDLWVEHYSKIPDEQRRLMSLKPIYYLDLES